MKREFHQTARTGKTRVWSIEVHGRFVTTQFGDLHGAMQTVVDEGQAKHVGCRNEVTPEEDALYLAGRAILKKTRNGYAPVGEEAPTEVTWDGVLPQNLRFYKPANALSAALIAKIRDNEAVLTRKRDGEMMVIVKWPDGTADIVSRTMLRSHHQEVGTHTWNDRFPHLIAEVEARDDIPPRTMLLGDVVCDPRDRDRWEVASFMKSKTSEALHLPPLMFYCWDVAFLDGEALLPDTITRERYAIIFQLFGKRWGGDSWILPLEAFTVEELLDDPPEGVDWDPHGEVEGSTPDLLQFCMDYADALDWEGWVVVDPEKALGDRGYNFRGKTDRPSTASGKLKPVFEADVVCFWDPDNGKGKWGRGKHRGQVGSMAVYQYDADGGLVYLCDCGGGIDDSFRAEFTSPSDFPIVAEVEYTDRTFKASGDKTNALTYPRLVRVRHDKTPDECVEKRLTYGEEG